MRPSQSARALRAIVRDLIATPDGATYFAERVWGVSVRYDLGGNHPLVGRSVPDFELDDGTRLNEHFQQGRALLLAFGGSDHLRTLADRYGDQVTYLRATRATHQACTPCSFAPMVLSLGQAIDLRMALTPLEYYRVGSTLQIASMGQRRDEESSNDSSRQKPPFGEAL